MANEEISCVPTVDDGLLSRAGVAVRGLRFSFFTNLTGEDEEELKPNSNNIWTDFNELWSPEKHNLRIRGELEVRDQEQFYGPPYKKGMREKGRGIVALDAKLGFVLEWVSTCSDLRTGSFKISGCILPTERNLGAGGKIYIFEHTFDPGTIKGSITLSIHAFVKTPAKHVGKDELMFMNVEGYLFSPPVNESQYLFQPDVVPFPLREVNEPDKPLWWLWIREMDDPAEEMFQDSNVRIYVNMASAGFDSLLIKKNRATLLTVHTDIIATAYYLLVQYLKKHKESMSYWGNMMSGEGLERNTIPEVIGRFLRESEIKTDGVSDEYLHQRISDAMRKRLSE